MISSTAADEIEQLHLECRLFKWKVGTDGDRWRQWNSKSGVKRNTSAS
jgi:hypothetical protein